MKKLLIILTLALLIFPTVNAILCENGVDTSDIPCTGITPLLSCSGDIGVTEITTSNMTNISTTPVGDGTYQFDFNFGEGNYSLIACDNSSASITVGDFPRDDLWKFAMMLAFIFAGGIFVYMGRFIIEEDSWIIRSYLYINGLLLGIIGVAASLLVSKSDRVDQIMVASLVLSIAVISIFFMYLLVHYTKEIIFALRDSRKNN